MAVEIVTMEQLQVFRLQLLSDIRQLLQGMTQKQQNEWLRNADVKKALKISSNTVQRLRISGKLRSSKIGGVHYYRLEDIEKLLESGF